MHGYRETVLLPCGESALENPDIRDAYFCKATATRALVSSPKEEQYKTIPTFSGTTTLEFGCEGEPGPSEQLREYPQGPRAPLQNSVDRRWRPALLM